MDKDREIALNAERAVVRWRAGKIPPMRIIGWHDIIGIAVLWWLLSHQMETAFFVAFWIWMGLNALTPLGMLVIYAASNLNPALGISEALLARFPFLKGVFCASMDCILVGILVYYGYEDKACALIGMYMTGYASTALMMKKATWLAENFACSDASDAT